MTVLEGGGRSEEGHHPGISERPGAPTTDDRQIQGFKPVGSTAEDDFLTRKDVVAVDRSEVSHVTLDG